MGSKALDRAPPPLLLAALLLLAASCPGADGADKLQEDLIAAARKARLENQRSGFNWLSASQYKVMDKVNNTKPWMFTFLSSHCYLCVGLLEHMATKESPTWLSSISSQFNAVLIYDSLGWEYVSPQYTPDNANYVPRTIFAWPNGTMRTDLVSRNAQKENQFYYLPRELLFQMWSILKEQRPDVPSDLEDDLPS